MNILLDVAVGLTIITASVSIVYMVRDFVQNIMLKDKLFERYIMKGWVSRTFDFWASVLSLVVVGILFWVGYFSIYLHENSEPSLFVIGALIGFPVLIKRLSVMQEQAEKSQQQIDIGQEQTRLNQYNEAKKLLWSEQLSSRMEGVEALWHFATTYPEKYKTVMETFAQFIKHPLPYELDEKRQNNLKSVRPQYAKWETPAGKREDIHAILRRMGEKRMAGAEPCKIDLRDTHLEEADLSEAHLDRAILRGAHLEGVDLSEAHLDRADLSGANLEGANLWRAGLEGAHLYRAHLEGANLFEAHLEKAYFFEAHLDRAYLFFASLKGANLSGANLGGADLGAANLILAVINNANFTDAIDLTQEQIDKCVFIIDHPFYKRQPKLPDGIKREYLKITNEEWKKERDEFLS